MTDTLLTQTAVLGRWIARLTGTALVLFFLVFLFGEGPPRWTALKPGEQQIFLGWGLFLASLLAAWVWPVAGGAVGVVGYLATGVHEASPAIVGLIASVLHLTCGFTSRSRQPLLPVIARGGGALAAVLFLLAANEMLGNPPAMAGWGCPPPPTGTVDVRWPRETRFVIAGRTASGTYGGKPIATAGLTPNRSWFGRLVHWRSDWMVTGRLADGTPFRAPI